MDLTVIILIQLSAFCYGIYNIAQGRPVWIAYNVDGFELVRNNDLVDQNTQKALPQFQHPTWLKPKLVGVAFAKDAKTRNDDMFAEVMGGISLAQKPERYVEFSQVQTQMKQKAQSLDLLQKYNNPNLVQNTLAQYPEANAFVPLKANEVDMTVLINKDQGEVVQIVDLRPWGE